MRVLSVCCESIDRLEAPILIFWLSFPSKLTFQTENPTEPSLRSLTKIVRMGADAGFDMVPRLSRGIEDRMKWEQFLQVVKQFYAGDEQVEVGPRVICFKAGEWPSLPIEGYKFLRFSSKITGSTAAETGVENYIWKVRAMAEALFGARIRPWNELGDEFGFYRWDFVITSIKSYELVCTLLESLAV